MVVSLLIQSFVNFKPSGGGGTEEMGRNHDKHCPSCDLVLHDSDAAFCKRCGQRLVFTPSVITVKDGQSHGSKIQGRGRGGGTAEEGIDMANTTLLRGSPSGGALYTNTLGYQNLK